ncbi:MAG: hypothetical protein KatS3mg003_2213 [Candidatus Nitrosocaldaceae archaeon]|nr:MAG: hypothetical protein KatS3mg003_2185 [Candidatus Nitrosocaldaceae archaeon]GIU72734.1 MAG: hypothetical protein KatS3mg003_2213 [Candidatus Nitrosocaldaceae archaeon]
MKLEEANVILRKGVIKAYFEPELMKIGYKRSDIKHPNINGEGYTHNNFLHIYFDLYSGSDYPDGDEWFIVEYLFPYDIALPDHLKGRDYFSTLSIDKGMLYWRHRELIRYKYGKTKKIEEAFKFIISKYEELSKLLKDASVVDKIGDSVN